MSTKRPTDFILRTLVVPNRSSVHMALIMFFFRMAPRLARWAELFLRGRLITRGRGFCHVPGVGDVAVLLNFPSIRPEVTLQAHRHCNIMLRWYDVSHSNHGPFLLYDNVDSCPKMVRWCFQLLHSISPI